MTDRIEALERLQRLRESGALSEDEFEREKAALFAPPREAVTVAAPGRGGVPGWALAAGAAAILLIAVAAALLMRRGGEREASDVNVAASAPQPQNVQANAVEPAPPSGIRTRPAAEQLRAAFRTAFGSDRSASRTSEGARITYTPGGLRWIGPRAVLVSAGRSDQDCHACSGAIAVHYLEADGDGFRVTGEWLDAGGGAGWGQPPEWRFSTALSDQPMLETSSGGMWQGCSIAGTAFYEFAPGGPREVASVRTHYSNEGAIVPESGEAAQSIEGVIRNVVKGRSFDVVYTGTERFTERYVRRGGRYGIASGESRMPGC